MYRIVYIIGFSVWYLILFNIMGYSMTYLWVKMGLL